MGVDTEEAEEGGGGKLGEATKKGHHMGEGHENEDEDDYDPLPLELLAAASSSDLEPVIPLLFGFQEAVETAVKYTKLAFSVLVRGYILVLLVASSL